MVESFAKKFRKNITNYNHLLLNVFFVIYAIWIIFYDCYSDPKITVEIQVIKAIFTQ